MPKERRERIDMMPLMANPGIEQQICEKNVKKNKGFLAGQIEWSIV